MITVAPAPSASVIAEPEATAKPAEPPEETTRRHQIALTLKPGTAPCTMVMEGGGFNDYPEWFMIMGVTRITTEESGGCAAGVVYDLAAEKKQNPPDMDLESLSAGSFLKPGQKWPAEMEDHSSWNVTEDLNFDDVMDLCVVSMTGAYNYSQYCWLFDTKSRTFVRNKALEELIFMHVDRKKQKLTNSYRLGGPVYANNEYVWQQGQLVITHAARSYFGEKPDGTPLPPGFGHWLIRYELRNGKLVKTFEGAQRETP